MFLKKGEEGIRVITCKKCNSETVIKSGIVLGRQRFYCKKCGRNFRMGDNRTDKQVGAKKLLCILLYFMNNVSFRTLGQLLQTDHSLIYRWIRAFDENLSKPQPCGEIKQIKIDELQHFIDVQKSSFDESKLLTVTHGELWPGCLATLIFQLPDSSTPKKELKKIIIN